MSETTKKVQEIFSGRVFSVHKDEIILSNGENDIREVVEHSGGVCVYAVVDDEVLLVRQYRYPFKREFIELPAGKLEIGEDPYKAAMRELREETGYQAKSLISYGCFIPSCAYLSEKIYLYKAEDLTFVGQDLDENEFLACLRMKVVDLKKMIKNNEIEDGKTTALCLKVWLD